MMTLGAINSPRAACAQQYRRIISRQCRTTPRIVARTSTIVPPPNHAVTVAVTVNVSLGSPTRDSRVNRTPFVRVHQGLFGPCYTGSSVGTMTDSRKHAHTKDGWEDGSAHTTMPPQPRKLQKQQGEGYRLFGRITSIFGPCHTGF